MVAALVLMVWERSTYWLAYNYSHMECIINMRHFYDFVQVGAFLFSASFLSPNFFYTSLAHIFTTFNNDDIGFLFSCVSYA